MIKWTIYSETLVPKSSSFENLLGSSPKAFVSFFNPVYPTVEQKFQISSAKIMRTGGACWRFYSDDSTTPGHGQIFILTDQARYRLWPSDILNQAMVHSFLRDNNVMFI